MKYTRLKYQQSAMAMASAVNYLLSLLSLCWLVSPTVDSANILALFPTASYSHQMPLLALPRALAQRGHNVTVITTNPLKEPMPNYTEIDISFTYNYWKSTAGEKRLINLDTKIGPIEVVNSFISGTNILTDIQLGSPQVQKFISYLDKEKPKFDLVLYEDLMHTSYLGFLHKLDYPPLVSMLTLPLLCGLDLSSGNVCQPSYISEMIIGRTNKMSFYYRLEGYLYLLYARLVLAPRIFSAQDALAKKYFGSSCPSTKDMVRNRSLLLSSSMWIFEYTRPVFPNTIHVGPLHIGDTKPLPQDLAKWVEGGKKGAIYFSLGSNVKSAALEDSKRTAILAALARFPDYRIIWKWENEELEGLPSNVICRKWLPQHDLLAHPNIKLFITQGGLQSLQEAVHFEVPVIGIPFFGDQNYNVKIIRRLGIGSYMEFEDIHTETLFENIQEILNNYDRYKKAVKRASDISKTQMMSPRDTAVWWVEYLLKADGNVSHLQPEYWHLTWYEYFGLDVYLVIFSPVILALYGLYRLVLTINRRWSKGKLKSE
ncbi:UDP-glucuronosyltransferase 2C1-like isoform X1 [Diaphorina citri]|uniref:UDP-glucuronosyltransferase 2C1-like isoform X1 n=3 Tax=Diaphorina citri TaxID=121845 RepID=A0A3Q0IJ72_DIACI|nr:UDP-glucuronosyltransferase 2C1-like isoform X1 [Diaphorina citri]